MYPFRVAGVAPLRVTLVALIIGAAAVAAVWTATYREAHPWIGLMLRPDRMPTTYTSSTWTTPAAALIGIAAIGVGVVVLRRRSK
jgi:hypothetical protein